MTRPSTDAPSRSRLPLVLLAAYLVLWAALAIAPWYREDWLLENLLVVIFVPWIVATHRRHPFGALACVGLFGFFVLHAIGSHYTYSKVPYDAFVEALTGRSLSAAFNLGRNHFDRLVHFGFGLLVTPAIVELLGRAAPARSRSWAVVGPLSFVMACSLAYELIEWGAAMLFGGDLGAAYLGTQGDPWDAQKDMTLASLGSLLALLGLAWTQRLRPRADGR